jgi:hypothetical protein
MPVPLRFELIHAIVRHGADFDDSTTVDPSLNQELREPGVAVITTYVEQLSLLDLVRDPVPMFGSQRGLWIGYKLSPRGRELAHSEADLKIAVASLTGDAQSEVSTAVASLQAECANASLNEVYREDFLKTLDEVRMCFDDGCFTAVLALCGKILEVCLKQVLLRHNVTPDPNAMIGALIRSIQERVPTQYLDPSLMHIVTIINKSRIPAVHAMERVPVPSRDQAIMVVFGTRDVVRRTLVQVSP